MEDSKLIFCEMILPEIESLGKGNLIREPVRETLHLQPELLREELQKRIAEAGCETVVLGYGLCGTALIGLEAGHSTLIIPRVED